MHLEAHEKRVELFEKEVEGEAWKQDHEKAMRCLAFETTLRFGIEIYDALIDFDEKVRSKVLAGHAHFDPDYDAAIHRVISWWLKPCAAVEKEIQSFRDAGFEIEQADAFRTRHADARWMLKSAGEAFDHPKMVESRDRAIDDLRAGKVV
jgi:hypothetical protein